MSTIDDLFKSLKSDFNGLSITLFKSSKTADLCNGDYCLRIPYPETLFNPTSGNHTSDALGESCSSCEYVCEKDPGGICFCSGMTVLCDD